MSFADPCADAADIVHRTLWTCFFRVQCNIQRYWHVVNISLNALPVPASNEMLLTFVQRVEVGMFDVCGMSSSTWRFLHTGVGIHVVSLAMVC